MKNPAAPAVKREAEEDWGRGRRMCSMQSGAGSYEALARPRRVIKA
jgi:hypothetical protein